MLFEMRQNTDVIREYFAKLGFGPEITAIYVALFTRGPQNVSELARSSGVERTHIYRLTETLAASNLVEVELHYKRRVYKAASIANIHILLAKKEQELRELRTGFEDIKDMFTQQNQQEATRVQFYNGPEGAKQIFWNETKAKSEVLVILRENMQNRTNSSFFERWVRRCNENGIKFRGIVNDHFIKTQQEWYVTHENERLENWQVRHLPASTFPINHSTLTYDAVVVHSNWSDGEVFGLEVYNKEIAATQRNYFELLWKLAQPVDDLSGQLS